MLRVKASTHAVVPSAVISECPARRLTPRTMVCDRRHIWRPNEEDGYRERSRMLPNSGPLAAPAVRSAPMMIYANEPKLCRPITWLGAH